MLKVHIGSMEVTVETFAHDTTIEVSNLRTNYAGDGAPKTVDVRQALKAILAYIS